MAEFQNVRYDYDDYTPVPVPTPVPDKPKKTYEDGVQDGKQQGYASGKKDGYASGLNSARIECKTEKDRADAEQKRLAAIEARRLFWDTAYLQNPNVQKEEANFDAKAAAQRADVNLSLFISDVQRMTPNQFLATERELDKVYAEKTEEYNKNHKWWDIFDPPPKNPMTVKRTEDGTTVKSIEFPSKAFTIPVTYWNSSMESEKIHGLSISVNNAGSSLDRTLALKALSDELSKLKIPQIAQLEAMQALQNK